MYPRRKKTKVNHNTTLIGDEKDIEDVNTALHVTGGQMSLETFQKALPPGRKNLASPLVLKTLNKILEDEDIGDIFRENLLSYTRILDNPNWKITEYIAAIKYVSHKLLGDTNTRAWAKVFPERLEKLQKRGASSDEIQNHVKAYNRGKMVTAILEQSLVPSWLLNQDKYQMAVNTQVQLMLSAKSEKVRSDAANSLLTHLKMPETAKVTVDMNLKEDDSISELRKVTMELAQMQKQQIEAGVLSAQDVALQKIVREEKVISEQ